MTEPDSYVRMPSFPFPTRYQLKIFRNECAINEYPCGTTVLAEHRGCHYPEAEPLSEELHRIYEKAFEFVERTPPRRPKSKNSLR